MNESISSNGQINIPKNTSVPRLEFKGQYYLDMYSIRKIIGEERVAKTTLFYMIKELPQLQEHSITWRNRKYFQEVYIKALLKHLMSS
jgi:hypothetical protein